MIFDIFFLSYQFIPNILFLLALLGIILLVLRRLPEAQNLSGGQLKELAVGEKLKVSKGLPTLGISKTKAHFKFWAQKLWGFLLEAKGLRPGAAAGYKIKKLFSRKVAGPKAVSYQMPSAETAPRPAAAPAQRNEKYFLELIKKEPKNLASYDGLGKYYIEQDNFSDAKDIYIYLTNHDSGNHDFYARLAFVCYQLRDYRSAAQHYQKSTGLDSLHPNRYYNLGLSLQNLGRFAEALKAFQQALQLEPGSVKFKVAVEKARAKIT